MTKNTLLLVFCLVLGFFPLVFGQNIAPAIEWQKCFGSTGDEGMRSGLITKDGGYIFAADISPANNGDLAGVPIRGSNDIWVVKLSANSTIQWQKCLGGREAEEPQIIIQTNDGGYIVAGTTYSNDGDVMGFHVAPFVPDIWVVKLSSQGVIQWQKCLGGTNIDIMSSIIQRQDGGYTLVGTAFSTDGDITCSTSRWEVRLSPLGVIESQQCFLPSQGYPIDLVKAMDGGYIVASSVSFDNAPLSHGDIDISITKFSASGSIQWQKYFGGRDRDELFKIIQTRDGGYAFSGTTNSNDGDVSGNHSLGRVFKGDIWVVKLSSTGLLEWQKCLGGNEEDSGRTISETVDGSFLIAANIRSSDGDVHDFRGGYSDGWAVKLSNQGILLWEKTLGGTGEDYIRIIQEIPNGGYLAMGGTDSNNLDVSGSHGRADAWIIKLSAETKAIVGQVQRANASCQTLIPPQYIANSQVKIEKNNGQYYISTDSLGRFGLFADTGRFNISALPPNQLFTACSPKSVTIVNPTIKDTVIINPTLFSSIICPLMEIDLTTPFLRRCFESQYVIHYANKGTAIQNDATAELTLDSALTYVSATRPVRAHVGNKITFSLGNVGINQTGQFTVNVMVSCNSGLGQTHCSSVLIPKTMTCDTVQDSIPSIVNQCVAGCDSVVFLVSKPNTTLNKTFKYQLIADATAVDTGRFVLTNTFNLKRKMDGRTYRLEIRNPVTNQLLVARSVESPPTVTTPSVSTGFVNQFAQSIKQTNIAENCTMNRGSFDPNDKAATPTGIGTRRFIEQGNTIEYLVRFQNTGTDTAFKVVVKDTLAAHFDLSSFKLNATSHTATWQLNPKGVLVVTFNNINLVDSFTNEKGSHGFFKYSIKLKDSILTNTLVTNKAAIYFDFNEPIITNLTSHTIGKEGLKSCLAKPAVSVSYSGCPSKNIVFNATSTSAGANPTYSWYRNNETTPLSTTNRLTLTNASNGTKIYCKLNASDDICTETPVVTSDTIVLNCIGVPTNELSIIQTFDVFPNPNKGVFTVKLNVAKPTKMQLSILNYLGQTIKSETITADNYAETFDLSAVPNGIYLVKLTIEGRSVVKKVSVQ
jgi:uncharacterized repeat protein (TIGR01451 family)